MRMSFLYKLNLNKVLLFFLIVLFAYSVAEALLAVMRERTLGSIFRHGLPTTPYLFLIIIISLYDIRKISFSSLVPVIPSEHALNLILKRFLLISFLAVLLGIFTSRYLVDLGLLYVPVIIMIIVSCIVSCFCMLTERSLIAIILFLVTMPFLYFIQINLHGILSYASSEKFEGVKISEVLIPLSAVYLIAMAFSLFIAKYKGTGGVAHKEKRNFIKLCAVFVLTPMLFIIFSKGPYHSFIYYLMDLVLPFIYFLVLVKTLKGPKDISIFVFALIVSIFLYQFFNLYFMYQQGSAKDISTGLYGSNIDTGFRYTLIPLMIPFQVAMYRLSKGWEKKTIGFILIIFIVYLFLSNYRTAILSSFIGFLIFYFFYYRISFVRKLTIVSVCLLGITIFLLYGNYLTEKLSYFRVFESFQSFSSGASIDELSSGRVKLWHSALDIIFDHPFTGIGPDMWSQYIPEYSRTNYFNRDIYGNRIRYYANDPHNLYLLIWINYGVISLICYLLIVYTVLRKAIRNIRKSSSNFLRIISIAAYISFVNWLIMSFFTLRFFRQPEILYALIFWSIIAVIFKINEFNSMKNINNEYAVQEK